MEIVIDILLWAMTVYLLMGFVFSVYFLFKGATRLDEDVMDSPWHFKLIIWPGVVLFWSLLFIKMIRK